MEPLWLLFALVLLLGTAWALPWRDDAKQKRKAKEESERQARELREQEEERLRRLRDEEEARQKAKEAAQRRAANMRRASKAYPGFWTEERIWERCGWDTCWEGERLRELLGPPHVRVVCEPPGEIHLFRASYVRDLEKSDEDLSDQRKALADERCRERSSKWERKRVRLKAEQQEAIRQAELKERRGKQIVVKLDDLPPDEKDS